MRVLGLITEYNPFHNGHKYHLEKSRELTGATHTVAVMSGNFLQRGDTALTNKWLRAEMAVKEGVDLVLELPVLYSCSSAELFAFGAVTLLNKLNVVDDLCFGSECGNIRTLKDIAEVLVIEPHTYKQNLKESLSKGYSFPIARSKALEKYFGGKELSKIIHSSNNILGIEYIKAMIRTNSSIKPSTIKRVAADYHSKTINSSISSATAIRTFLSNSSNQIEDLKKVLPHESFNILSRAIAQGYSPVFVEALEQAILSSLRRSSPELLREIMDVNEGLENRIKSTSLKSSDIETFYNLTATKRYTLTRVKRITVHALLGILKNHYTHFASLGGCQYARVLALSHRGAEILRRIKTTSEISVITNIAKQYPTDKNVEKMLLMDIEASDLYSLGYPKKKNRSGSSDFCTSPYVLNL